MNNKLIFSSVLVILLFLYTNQFAKAHIELGPYGEKIEHSHDTEKIKEQRQKLISDMKEQKSVMMEQRKTAREKLMEMRKTTKENLCVFRENKLRVLNEWKTEALTNRTTAYADVIKAANELITKAETNDVDSTTLLTNLKELETMLTTLKTDIDAFESALSKSELTNCDETSKDNFKANREEIYATARKLKQDKSKVHAYIRSKILPEMKKLVRSLNSNAEEISQN